MLNYLLRGISIGVIFGVPVGVVGLLTIQTTIKSGFLKGVVFGLGSSLADMFYAMISIFGLTIITDFLLKHQKIISVLGCGIIIYIGFQMINKENKFIIENEQNSGVSSILTSFMITLSNPASILSFMVIFSTFGMSGNTDTVEKILVILGIFIGTSLWWIILSGITLWSQRKFLNLIYKYLNKCFGIAIILLGLGMCIFTLID